MANSCHTSRETAPCPCVLRRTSVWGMVLISWFAAISGGSLGFWAWQNTRSYHLVDMAMGNLIYCTPVRINRRIFHWFVWLWSWWVAKVEEVGSRLTWWNVSQVYLTAWAWKCLELTRFGKAVAWIPVRCHGIGEKRCCWTHLKTYFNEDASNMTCVWIV